MNDLLNFLNSIQPLSEPLLEYLITNVKRKHIKKKRFLLKFGQISQDVFFINEGVFRCFYLVNNKEVSSYFKKEGDVIASVISLFNQVPSKEAIQALGDCVVYYITYDELQFIYQHFPEFNLVGRIITQRYYALSMDRLYSIRMQRAPDRYAYLIDKNPDLILRVASKYIASYLGITEQTLSNIKSNL